MAKGAGRAAEDITAGVATGAVDIGALEADKLPADLRGKSKDEIKQEIEAKAKQREAAQKEMAELAKQRAQYLKDHAKDGDGFDAKVKATVDHELK